MELAYPILTAETKTQLLGYRGQLEELLGQIKSLGYDGVELLIRDPNFININEIQILLDRYQLNVAAVSTAPIVSDDQLVFSSQNNNVRDMAIERTKEVIDFAAQLSSPIHIGKLRGTIDQGRKSIQEELVKEAFKIIGQYANERNVKVAIEPQNHQHINYLNTVNETLEFIDDLQIDSLHIMLDTYHLNISEDSLYSSLQQAKDQLIFMHFADTNRLVPGKGELDFKAIIQILKEINYEGYLSMEIKQEPSSYNAAQLSIDYLQKFIK